MRLHAIECIGVQYMSTITEEGKRRTTINVRPCPEQKYLVTKKFGNPGAEISFRTAKQMAEIERWNDVQYGSSGLCDECLDFYKEIMRKEYE